QPHRGSGVASPPIARTACDASWSLWPGWGHALTVRQDSSAFVYFYCSLRTGAAGWWPRESDLAPLGVGSRRGASSAGTLGSSAVVRTRATAQSINGKGLFVVGATVRVVYKQSSLFVSEAPVTE